MARLAALFGLTLLVGTVAQATHGVTGKDNVLIQMRQPLLNQIPIVPRSPSPHRAFGSPVEGAGDAATALLQSVEEALRRSGGGHGAALDPEAVGVIHAVAGMMNTTIRQSILDNHASLRPELDQQLARFWSCTDATTAPGLAAKAEAARVAHAQCRTKQGSWHKESSEACGAWHSFLLSRDEAGHLENSGCGLAPTNFSMDALEVYNGCALRWLAETTAAAEALHRNCTNATEERKATEAKCGTAQAEFEEVSCDLAQSICTEVSSCKVRELSALEGLVSMMRPMEARLKHEWVAVERVMCYLDGLSTNHTTTNPDVVAKLFGECGNATINTSGLDIIFPNITALGEFKGCSDLLRPCHEDWLAREYGNLPLGVHVVECQSCSLVEIVEETTPAPACGEIAERVSGMRVTNVGGITVDAEDECSMVVMPEDFAYLSIEGTGMQPDEDFTLVSKVKKSSSSEVYDILLDTLLYRWGFYHQNLYTWKWGYRVWETSSVANEEWHTVALRKRGGQVEQFLDGINLGAWSRGALRSGGPGSEIRLFAGSDRSPLSSPVHQFHGKAAYMRWFSRSLSDAEIAAQSKRNEAIDSKSLFMEVRAW
mmetsp:Transcript_71566/g.180606  ORF Transcript_71566/g.180606 Transcript_71566/m.180606 type:complete len:599 (+) Transcript_71566:60-1856(+)